MEGNSSANLIVICESSCWLTVPRSSEACKGLEFITSSRGGVELLIACKLRPKGDESGRGVAEGSVPWKGKLEFRSDERAVRTMLPLIGFEQRGHEISSISLLPYSDVMQLFQIYKPIHPMWNGCAIPSGWPHFKH